MDIRIHCHSDVSVIFPDDDWLHLSYFLAAILVDPKARTTHAQLIDVDQCTTEDKMSTLVTKLRTFSLRMDGI